MARRHDLFVSRLVAQGWPCLPLEVYPPNSFASCMSVSMRSLQYSNKVDLHHSAEYTDKLGGIVEFRVIHGLLRSVHILNCASSDASRCVVIVETVP